MNHVVLAPAIPPDRPLGSWWLWGDRIMVCCPLCGFQAELEHHVDAEGQVTPSLWCPTDCGFHAIVTLSGWTAL